MLGSVLVKLGAISEIRCRATVEGMRASVVSMASGNRDGTLLETQKSRVKPPPLYKVMLLNDDYTTMEFVVQVLETVFQKSPAEAYRVMMAVHVQGRGVAGIYPWEVAETKAEAVISLARDAGYPLKAVTEEA